MLQKRRTIDLNWSEEFSLWSERTPRHSAGKSVNIVVIRIHEEKSALQNSKSYHCCAEDPFTTRKEGRPCHLALHLSKVHHLEACA